MPAKPRSTCWSGSTNSTRYASSEAQEGGHGHIPLNVGVGLNTGDLRRRQHGFRPAIRLFGARRQRQPGLAAGRAIQGIRIPDHRRLQDRACGQGQVRDSRARFHHGQGQEGAGGHLCHRRPRGHRAVRPLPALAQPDHRDAGLLSQPRLGRRARGDRARPHGATTPMRWSFSTISTRREFTAIRTTRRRKTGTARSRC